MTLIMFFGPYFESQEIPTISCFESNKPVSSCLWWCISVTDKQENFWMYLLLEWTQLLCAYRISSKSLQSYQDIMYSNPKLKKDFHRPFWYNSFSMDT